MENELQWAFEDERLKTAHSLHCAMVEHHTVSLRQLGKRRAGEVRYGRFLHNPRVTPDNLMEAVCSELAHRGQGEQVLLIQDTSKLNDQTHAKRVKGLPEQPERLRPILLFERPRLLPSKSRPAQARASSRGLCRWWFCNCPAS